MQQQPALRTTDQRRAHSNEPAGAAGSRATLQALVFGDTADRRQRMRMARFLMGAGSSVLIVALFGLGYALDFLPLKAFAGASAMIAICVAVFFVLFRSRLNLRFSDPSLTFPQILASVLITSWVLYHAGDARTIYMLIYMVAFLFGVFQFRAGKLALLQDAGHEDFRDARGPMGFTQRQAAGKFTVDEATAFIDTLELFGCGFSWGGFESLAAVFSSEGKITEAFKTGNGVGWHEHDQRLFSGTERFFRPGYNANLVSSWIPALEGMEDKLRKGAKVADIGCGHGASP